MILDDWAQKLHSEVCQFCDVSLAPRPSCGWVAAQSVRVLQQYPAGVPRAVLLTEVEAAWNLSMRRGEHSGRLKQVLSSKQLAHGERIYGRLQGGLDAFRYRLLADGLWIDVIMHKQYQDFLGFLKHVGCSFGSDSAEGVHVEFSNCRLLKSSVRKPVLLPAEQAMFLLDGKHNRSLIHEPLTRLHESFCAAARGCLNLENVNNSVGGVFCEVLGVSEVLPYPSMAARPKARQFRTALLQFHGPQSGSGLLAGSQQQKLYLVLFDHQVSVCELFGVGDLLFIYRPWVAANSEEIGVFGGSVDHLHRPIGGSVVVPAAEHVAQHSAVPCCGIHFCLGAVTCIAKIRLNEPSSAEIGSPRLQPLGRITDTATRRDRDPDGWDCWGRIARLVFVRQPATVKRSSDRTLTIFAEIVGTGQSFSLPVAPICKCSAYAASPPRCFLALQCRVGDLPGIARGGGRALRPGQLALFTALLAQNVSHIHVLSGGDAVNDVSVMLYHASLSGTYCAATAEAVVGEVQKNVSQMLFVEIDSEPAVRCPGSSPTSVAAELDERPSARAGMVDAPVSVGSKRRISCPPEMAHSTRVCCVLYDRMSAGSHGLAAGGGPKQLAETSARIVNFSAIAALACSPSLLLPSLHYIRRLGSGEGLLSGCDLYGLVYGRILMWESDESTGRVVAGVLVREASGCSQWFEIDQDCVVASSSIALTPHIRVDTQSDAQFCILVSKLPQNSSHGSGKRTATRQYSHRIDVIADVNPSGLAMALTCNAGQS